MSEAVQKRPCGFHIRRRVRRLPDPVEEERHSEDPYGRASSLLNRVMVVAVVDFIWMGVIVWTSGGVNVESLLCLPVIFLVVLGPVYIRLRRYYRRMQKSEDQSTN